MTACSNEVLGLSCAKVSARLLPNKEKGCAAENAKKKGSYFHSSRQNLIYNLVVINYDHIQGDIGLSFAGRTCLASHYFLKVTLKCMFNVYVKTDLDPGLTLSLTIDLMGHQKCPQPTFWCTCLNDSYRGRLRLAP